MTDPTKHEAPAVNEGLVMTPNESAAGSYCYCHVCRHAVTDAMLACPHPKDRRKHSRPTGTLVGCLDCTLITHSGWWFLVGDAPLTEDDYARAEASAREALTEEDPEFRAHRGAFFAALTAGLPDGSYRVSTEVQQDIEGAQS